MTPNDFVQVIPDVLLYIVPGFLTLKIIEKYSPRKKHLQYESILWSVLYSFVVKIEFAFICWFCGPVCQCIFDANGWSFVLTDDTKLLVYFLLSIATGFLFLKASNSHVGRIITLKFNPNMVPGANIWFESLRTQKGAWATIYLNNGLIYTGMLTMFTADPEENKLILLEQYRLMQRTPPIDGNTSTSEAFCRVIEDKTKDDTAKVLLRFEDITAIEMVD